MSNFYIQIKSVNPRTRSLACKLVDSAYTFSALDTVLADVMTLGDPVFLTRNGSVTSGTITYDPSDPIFTSVPSSGEANAIVVYDVNTTELIYYITISTIDVKSLYIRVVIDASGLAKITQDLSTVDWTLQKYEEASGTDYNSAFAQATISTLADSLPLAIVTFTKYDSGNIVGVQANPIIYDKQVGGTDYNKSFTKSAIETIIGYDSSPLAICTFTKFTTGTIYSFDRNPVPIDATATYEVEAIGVPNLIVTRAVDGLSAEIDCDNLPTGYEIKLFRGEEFRGTKISTTELIDLDAGDLPYTDSGLVAANNYKYYGKFTATGDINATPTTVQGARGQSIILIPNSARIP